MAEESSNQEPSEALQELYIAEFIGVVGGTADEARSYLQAVPDWNPQLALDHYFAVMDAAGIQREEFDPTLLAEVSGPGGVSNPSNVPKPTGSRSGSAESGGSASVSPPRKGNDSFIQTIPVVKSPKPPTLEVDLIDSSSDEEQSSSRKKPRNNRNELVFITYNIGGRINKKLTARASAVCQIIQDTKADIVFLQEVVPSTAELFRDAFNTSYTIIPGDEDEDHFTFSFFRKSTVNVISHKLEEYGQEDNSQGQSGPYRNMVIANVKINGVTINVLNTHLDGDPVIDFLNWKAKSASDDQTRMQKNRILQFEEINNFVSSCPSKEPVIIAGDFNMSEEELEDSGGLPPDLIDAWIATGRKKECEFTWDMTRNSNLQINFGFSVPRCRFARILLRDSEPSKVTPVLFNLIGTERIKSTKNAPEKKGIFPSDHWGILCIFNTNSPSHN